MNTLRCLILLAPLLACSWEPTVSYVPRQKEPEGFVKALSDASLKQTKSRVRYDAGYRRISYPGGDVPGNTGVCADVVIRSYRVLGIDLQKEVHEEMEAKFHLFPNKWGLKSPDTNIDHRRVPNLQVFFKLRGATLSITGKAQDYQPGDIVTWSVFGRPHIGIVVNKLAWHRRRFMIVHNMGRGPKLEDMLFDWRITGHYRFYGSPS